MNIKKRFDDACEVYAEHGVDVKKAVDILKDVEISLQCWQGDDVLGFEVSENGLSGGIMTTGNYPGRARTPEELRADLEKAFSCIPGKQRVNVHASYLESGGKFVDRDKIETKHFQGWIDWAKEKGTALDFNTTMFSHKNASSNYTISDYDKGIRDFWVEHGKRCRDIAEAMGKAQGSPCVLNHWMPDGCKDSNVDRYERRKLFIESMDRILEKKISTDYVLDSLESKLFGIGVESFTVGSAETVLGYALSRNIMVTYDLGHFHPTESIADKISSTLLYVDKLLLHTSRGVRWDSDHVVIQSDDVFALMQEVVRANALDRVKISLDYFDASINRVAAWVIGTRATLKALLFALLEPVDILKEYEKEGDTTSRLALLEEYKTLPWVDVWNYFCEVCCAPIGESWLADLKKYENDVQMSR